MQGGFSGGYSTSDNCEVREKVPEIALLNPYCHIETSFLPQYKGLATYIAAEDRRRDQRHVHQQAWHPGERLRYAGRRRRVRGQLHRRRTPSSQPILGRPLAGSAPNITVNLIEPHSILGERVNELNMRVGKIFRFGSAAAPTSAWTSTTC